MTESALNRLVDEFIYQCQHRTGRRRMERSKILNNHLRLVLAKPLEDVVNDYIRVTHVIYHKNKKWKSYDW